MIHKARCGSYFHKYEPQNLKSKVKDILPEGSYISAPQGADVLEWVRLHYSAMEQAARQIDILSEILM